jgi:ATP-dependent DNA helicase RecG
LIDVPDKLVNVPDKPIDVPDDVPENATNVPEKSVDVPESATNVPDNVPEKSTDVPEKRWLLICEMIGSNREISMQEIARTLHVNEKTIKRDMQKLKTVRRVERVGPDKGGYWKLID